MPNYANTVIYKLYCKDEEVKDIYVGSTVDFKERMWNHKGRCNNPNCKRHNLKVYKFIRANGGWDNWHCKIIEYFPCNNRKEKLLREQEVYEEMMELATLNSDYPVRVISKADYDKIYRKENKEKIRKRDKEYGVKYRGINREKIRLTQKEWRKNNKEKLKKKVQCDCGSIVRSSDISRHRRTPKHKQYILSFNNPDLDLEDSFSV